MSPSLILSLETATPALSVALSRGETPWIEERPTPPRPAAECLLPAVDAVLERAQQSLDAVDVLAVSIGPGSFTGLRIGVATIKGLAFASSRPAVPVSTLEALALSGRQHQPAGRGPVVALLDARRDEVYAAAWSGEAPDACLPEGVYTESELAERLPAQCLLLGDGVAVVGQALRTRLGPGVRLAPPEWRPAASCVGMLAARALAAGGGIDPALLVPRYLRRAEAEVKRTGERFESPRSSGGGR